MDNYIIHKSWETQRWLKENPKSIVINQPVDSPRVNDSEPLCWHGIKQSSVSISKAATAESTALYGTNSQLTDSKQGLEVAGLYQHQIFS